MPLLTADNLGYLARGARRWLYGAEATTPPEVRQQWEAEIADRTGRVVWLFVFGPASHRGILSGEAYRLLYSVGVGDSWSAAAGIGRPAGMRTIEEHFARELEENPLGTCDVVVVLLDRNRSTPEGIIAHAKLADEDFRRCSVQVKS